MLLPKGTVFAIVDGENFELYRNTGMEASPRLTSIDVPDLETTNYSAGAKDHDKDSRMAAGTPTGRQSRLEESAHVAAVTNWLNAEVLQNRIEKLVVVADPRSLGEMRRHYHKELEAALISEVPKTMTGRPTAEIVSVLHG